MVSESTKPPVAIQDADGALRAITDVLLAVARGDYHVQAARTYAGDPLDVLAFLVNTTAEEVGSLVRQLEDEREQLALARDQLLLASKLVALGELAAGVAHELNQPLTAMRMLTDLLRQRPDTRVGDCEKDLELLAEATRRMSKIVDSVRTFGRAGPLECECIDPLEPLADAVLLLSEAFDRDGVVLEQEFSHKLPSVSADADRMHQVFVNLLTNARDSVRARAPGDRKLRVGACVNDGHVRYWVEDNGPGVPAELVLRIFDPFFTTKEVGQGTGLGLSVSHGIVEDHGGTLRHESVETGGARFIVELPVLVGGVGS